MLKRKDNRRRRQRRVSFLRRSRVWKKSFFMVQRQWNKQCSKSRNFLEPRMHWTNRRENKSELLKRLRRRKNKRLLCNNTSQVNRRN